MAGGRRLGGLRFERLGKRVMTGRFIRKTHLSGRRPHQNGPRDEPLAELSPGYELRQGTTSVVPQMANLDSALAAA